MAVYPSHSSVESHTSRPPRLIRLAQVTHRVGLSATTIWRQRHAGRFPQPVQISPGCVAWREADVDAWIESRPGATAPSLDGGHRRGRV